MNSHVEILQAHGEDARRWSEIVALLPESRRDVHYLPEYAALYEKPGMVAQAALYTHGSHSILYPFMRREVQIGGERMQLDHKPVYDMAVPYGIGGPVCTADGADAANLYAAFDPLFVEWCCKEGFASEFLCPHMYTGSLELVKSNKAYCTEVVKPVVVVDVSGGEEAIRQQLRKGHKAAITQARKSCVVVSTCEPDAIAYDAFLQLYASTMDRHNAAARWYFEKNYFMDCHKKLPEGCGVFFQADVEAHLASWCIVLRYGDTVYYHFAASDPNFNETRASTLMLHTVCLWAHEQGCKRVYLGGGATNTPDDGILRFKSGFSKNAAMLHHSYRVLSARHYQYLTDAKIASERLQGAVSAQPDYFPLYRRP